MRPSWPVWPPSESTNRSISRLRAKDFRLNKLFTDFGPLLVANFASAYRRKREFVYRFRSFDKDSELSHIPDQLKVRVSGGDKPTQEQAFERATQVAPLSGTCADYFDMRSGLATVDLDHLRHLAKTVQGVLIRKRILEKKRRKKRVLEQIGVGVTKGIRRIKTNHVGELKKLKLEIEDEISCLKLFQRITRDSGAESVNVEARPSKSRLTRSIAGGSARERPKKAKGKGEHHFTHEGNLQTQLQGGGKRWD